MIRILLVEDSVVQREILRRVLGGDDTFTIVGEARNGKEAVLLVEALRPDVVLMDIHMPDMNGVEATREIMRRFPVPIVVASATLKKRDIDLGLEALHAGAVSVIAKPEGAVLLNLEKISARLREEIFAASRIKLRALPKDDAEPSAARPTAGLRRAALAPPPAGIKAIGICASTGGPPVLIEILSALPRPYALPILLVQHITQGFEESFARWLSQRSGQPVALAKNGQRLAPGVWLAPGGSHLALASSRTLTRQEKNPADIHCPSGNVLFHSLARHLGDRAAGILLTGMGDDGAVGLLELKKAGGTTIIQDEATSFIWGMPKVGKELHAAAHELSPREIGQFMAAW